MPDDILVNTRYTLAVEFSTGYADAAVTCTVTDQDNLTVASGPAVKDTATFGRYTFVLPPQPAPAWLVVNWQGTFSGVVQSVTSGAGQTDGTGSDVQVVGGHLFTLDDLRQFGNRDLENPSVFPDQVLLDKRTSVTQMVEDYCHVAFFTRYARVTLDGTMTRTLWLPHLKVQKLRSAVVNGVALSTQQLGLVGIYPTGKLDRADLWPIYIQTRNITVGYEHGYSSAPLDLARAAMMIARYELRQTEFSERAQYVQNEFGAVRFAPVNPTGIAWADAVLQRYRQASPYELPV
jgi:hypothetical protein